MKFVVAGGGVAGLACALAVVRAGHSAVVIERDFVRPDLPPEDAFKAVRNGIPHFFQPHAFLPRGRLILQTLAPDVLELLEAAGAEPQDLTQKLRGPREPHDDELVFLWARRPLIEWALRRAASAEPGIELVAGEHVEGLLTGNGDGCATGVAVTGNLIEGDVVVDALGRYRCPPGWPRASGEPTDSGAIYYCRYFQLADGIEHMDAPLLNPRGDLGYMGFNTFRGDNRTYAVILLVPAVDRDLRVLKNEAAWMTACSLIRPLDEMTSPDYGRPITDVMPMGGLMNVDRTGEPGVRRLVAVGDALCHTDPAFAYGLSFSLAHAEALGRVSSEDPNADSLGDRYREAVGPEARERHALVCATDAARARRWSGEPLDIGRRDGCYPLFSFPTAIAAAPHDDHVLRRTVRRIGLLDRTAVFDQDAELHERIEAIFGELTSTAPPLPGPPREELLGRLQASVAVA